MGGSSFKVDKNKPGIAAMPSSALVSLVPQQQRNLPEKWGAHEASPLTVMQGGLANDAQRGGGYTVTQPPNSFTWNL